MKMLTSQIYLISWGKKVKNETVKKENLSTCKTKIIVFSLNRSHCISPGSDQTDPFIRLNRRRFIRCPGVSRCCNV